MFFTWEQNRDSVKPQLGGSADGTHIKKGLNSRKWITNEIKNCCLNITPTSSYFGMEKNYRRSENVQCLHRWGPSQSSRHLITAAENCRRALWRRQAGAADLCCRTGQTLVRPQAGQRLVAGDGGQGAAQASQRLRLFFTWMKQRGVIQRLPALRSLRGWQRRTLVGPVCHGRPQIWTQHARVLQGRPGEAQVHWGLPQILEALPARRGQRICQTHGDFET